MELDLKKLVEQEIGYEVDKIESFPVFEDGKLIGLSVKFEPKTSYSIISHDFIISKNEYQQKTKN